MTLEKEEDEINDEQIQGVINTELEKTQTDNRSKYSNHVDISYE